MIKNYLVLFVRNFKRQKLFSFINLSGLTLSIVCTLLIYLYVRYELSFDRFHKNVDRIYRVNQTFIWGEHDSHQFASTGPGVAHALKEELPEVELITSIHTPGNFIISYTTQSNKVISFEEDKILAGDSNFFKMFSFPLIKGDAATALTQSHTLVMTESTAKKYFDQDDPIGKLVRLGKGEKQQTFEVTGIVKDTPDNSYIDFDVLLSTASFPIAENHWSWIWTQLETYVLLYKNTDIENTRAKLALIPKKYAEETLRRTMNTTYEDYIKSGKKWELFLQPFTNIHLPSDIVYNRISNSGNIVIIYALIGAAIFIALLSCINFMNLSTAQFTRRIKEASVRKIMGLSRLELSFNYFFEAVLFCVLALVAGLFLTQLLLPAFNYGTGKSLEIDLLHDTGLVVAMLALVLVMGLISGSYPALFLSAFHPVEAMKGKLKTGREGRAFRNGLVIFQFSVSIILIISTAIIFQQITYLSEKDLGFEKENLLFIKHIENVQDEESMLHATVNVPGVLKSTLCTSVPPAIMAGDKFSAEGMDDKTFSLNFTTADEYYLPTLKIKLLYGRNYSADVPGDVDRVILNEAAVKKIGWTLDESVIGKKIETPGGDVKFEVIGVVKDFNYWSLIASTEPMAIFNFKTEKLFGVGEKQFIVLKIAGQNSAAWQQTFATLGELWKKHAGDTPFEYDFVDQAFAETYKTQKQFSHALTVMASMAILIACLGLLGMIIYTLELRMKEIGIRKVSGASAINILTLISQGYTKLILISFLIGAPLSYWMMNEWLQDFAYRITPSPWIFILTGLGILVAAFLITGYHSIKAALTNPITVLKDE